MLAEIALNHYQLWPLMLYVVLVIGLVLFILGLSYILGQRHEEKATHEIYESGIKPTGDTHVKFSSKYYVVAMFFVIFDLEAAFIVAWAISYEKVGWLGYVGILLFIVILFAVLIYEWRIGALDFGPNGNKILKAYRKRKKLKVKDII